jgi:hypothetical protein
MAGKTNVPSLKGARTGKPSGSSTQIPQGQYPTVQTPGGLAANVKPNLDALTQGKGQTTVNSRPSS